MRGFNFRQPHELRVNQKQRKLMCRLWNKFKLTRFHMENVIEPGMAAMQLLIDRGVERGEFRETGLRDFPQLLVAPFLMSVLWRLLFERHRHLDTDAMLATHIDLMVRAIRADGGAP